MDVELVTFCGVENGVKMLTHKDVKRMEPCGILNVKKVIILLDVVSVLLIVPLNKLILVFLARNKVLMVEELDILYHSEITV